MSVFQWSSLRSVLLLSAWVAASLTLAYWLLGGIGLLLTGGVTAIALLGSRNGELALRVQGARLVPTYVLPWLSQTVEVVAKRAGLLQMPRLLYIDSPTPSALTTETSDGRGAIAVTSGLLQHLAPAEIEAVLAHEVSHLAHRDTLIMRAGLAASGAVRITLSIATAAAIVLALLSGQGLSELLALFLFGFGAPLLFAGLQAAVSRAQEYAADARAAELTGDARPLASALLRIESLGSLSSRAAARVPSWLSSHPETQSRVKRLWAAHRRNRAFGV